MKVENLAALFTMIALAPKKEHGTKMLKQRFIKRAAPSINNETD